MRCNREAPNMKKEPIEYEPATIGDMIEGNHGLTAHCRTCGHWTELDPAKLPLHPERSIPSLEGAFKCAMCKGRDTCAMPDYGRRRWYRGDYWLGFKSNALNKH
jgi:hypothetical protein